jgi:hypothetical protein
MADEEEELPESGPWSRTALPDEVRAFIVCRYACYDCFRDIQAGVKEHFELDLTRSTINNYNFDVAHWRQRAPAKWIKLFESQRKAFLKDMAASPIANPMYRMRQLQLLYERWRDNPIVAADLLKQAAQEAGGLFTNRREITGANGGPIQLANFFAGWTNAELEVYANTGQRPNRPLGEPAERRALAAGPSEVVIGEA